MSSVPPLLTPNLPPAAPAAAVTAEVVVVQGTAQMAARVAALRILEALVVAQQRDGAALLRTDLGTLQVKLPLPVTDGARLTLQVGTPAGTPLPAGAKPAGPTGDSGFPALKLTGIDGRALTQAMLAGRTPATTVAGRPAVDLLPPSGGEPTLLATLVKPAMPEGTGLSAGSAFPVRLLSVTATPESLSGSAALSATPAATPAATPTATSPPGGSPLSPPPGSSSSGAPLGGQSPGGQSPGGQSPGGQSPGGPSPGGPSLGSTAPGGAPMPGNMPAAAAGTTPAAAAAPAPPPQPQGAAPSAPPATAPASTMPTALTGIVAPNTLAGQPLVQTGLGLISLQGGPSLPAGAQVALQVMGPATPASATAAPASLAPAGQWGGVSQALATLGQSDPAAAARLAAALPELGPRLASGMVAFVAAAQRGVLRPVVGERAAQALEKAGRPDMAKHLMQDLEQAQPQTQRDVNGEWRAMTMPLLNGSIVEPVQLYLRRPNPDGEASGAASGDQGQRFVVDVSLTALGRLQIDGLMRRSLKRLDVLVRSAQPLPGQMRQDIARIFAASCSASGVSGEAGFQVTNRFVEPTSEAPAQPTGLLA